MELLTTRKKQLDNKQPLANEREVFLRAGVYPFLYQLNYLMTS
jgi:hypothetical protein